MLSQAIRNHNYLTFVKTKQLRSYVNNTGNAALMCRFCRIKTTGLKGVLRKGHMLKSHVKRLTSAHDKRPLASASTTSRSGAIS